MTQRGCVPFASSACAHILTSNPHNSTNACAAILRSHGGDEGASASVTTASLR
jgi:hypothetical protein